jgi:predicted DNA-binding transcriptional regulator YafY
LAEIGAALEEKFGENVSINSITDDIRAMEKTGLAKRTGRKKVARDTGRGAYGRFEKNYLEPWELKILADAVLQVPWLRRFDVYGLRNKLLGMTSDSIARKVRNTLHPLPENMYHNDRKFSDNLNKLLDAIDSNRKVTFHYIRLGKRRSSLGIHYDPDTKPARVVSPYDIYTVDGKFYMVGYSDQDKGLRTYRIDRMILLQTLNVAAIAPTRTPFGDSNLELETFYRDNTDNFLGERRLAMTVRWDDATHISVLYDVMGTENVFLISEEDNTFSIRTYDNDGLMNNLLRLGSAIEILEPKLPRRRYLAIIEDIRRKYKEE